MSNSYKIIEIIDVLDTPLYLEKFDFIKINCRCHSDYEYEKNFIIIETEYGWRIND